MEIVTLINRTSRPLEVLWDGKSRPIPVGKSQHSLIVAQKAKEQNVLMGSQDPRTGDIVYLVAIEEHGEDSSPVEPNPNPREKWNRKLMPGGEKAVEVVPGRTGYMSMADNKLSTGNDVVATAFEPNPVSAKIPETL